MPRIARIVAPGLPHHVTQRGNRRADVFLDSSDRSAYLNFLAKYRSKHKLEILAYCLMSNHIHLIVIPKEPHSLARMLADCHMRYAKYFNWKYLQTGHLWEGRFFSCVMDENHALAAMRYVERNPVRALLVKHAWDYRWSSAAAHADGQRDVLVSNRWPPREMLTSWRDLLTAPEDGATVSDIRRATRTGRPTGTDAFLDKIERTLGRLVRPRTAGRPKKG